MNQRTYVHIQKQQKPGRLLRLFFCCLGLRVISEDDLVRASKKVPFQHLSKVHQDFYDAFAAFLAIFSSQISERPSWRNVSKEAYKRILAQQVYTLWSPFIRQSKMAAQGMDGQMVSLIFAPRCGRALLTPNDNALPLRIRFLTLVVDGLFRLTCLSNFVVSLLKVSFYLALPKPKALGERVDLVWIEPKVVSADNDRTLMSLAGFVRELQEKLTDQFGLTMAVNAAPGIEGYLTHTFSKPWHLLSKVTFRELMSFYGDSACDIYAFLRAVFTGDVPKMIVGAQLPEYRFYRLIIESQKIRGIVCSVSSVGNKQPWLAGAALANVRSMMLFYSSNCWFPQPISQEGLEFHTGLQTDFFVWDQACANWLKERAGISEGRTRIVGPIMFTSAQPVISQTLKDHTERNRFVPRIGIFDVTPPTSLILARVGHGLGVYNLAICKQFVEDIIDVSLALHPEATFLFKLKRMPLAGHHNDEYLNFIEALTQKYGKKFFFVPPKENAWSAILSCSLVVGNAYTSVVDAAGSLGIPSAFYYPFPGTMNTPYKSWPLFSTKDELRDWIEAHIRTTDVSPEAHLIEKAQQRLVDVIAETIGHKKL